MKFKIGDLVFNISYGSGTVVEREDDDRYAVMFDNYGDVFMVSEVRLTKTAD